MLEPQGPLPPSVYWRRRAVAIMSVVVLLGLAVWGVSALAGGGETAAAAPGPPAPTPRPASFAQASDAAQAAREGRPAAAESDTPSGRTATTVEPEAAQDDAEGGNRRSAQEGQQDRQQQDRQASPRSGSPQGADTRPAPAASGSPPPPAPLFAPPAGAGRALLPGSVLGPLPSPSATPSAPSATPSAPSATPPAPSAPPTTVPAPSARSAPASPPAVAPGAVPACPDSAIAVNARTDKPRYAPGEKPVFSLVVTNAGTVACARDLDAARQAVAVVRTPGDGLWGSDDCSPASTDDVRTLRPGEQVVFSVRWSRLSSMPGCPKPRTSVEPGTYQLLARLDGTISEPARFTLQG